jgi:hypothetical protein
MSLSRIINLGEDSIARLKHAANVRHREAAYLAEGGHHLTSIYLAGYALEMTIGAAYFGEVLGYGPKTIIVASVRRGVLSSAKLLSRVEDKSHPIDGLARYLLQEKSRFEPPGYDRKFAETLIARVEEVCQYWAPRLRYRSIEANSAQSKLVLKATSWIMANCPSH